MALIRINTRPSAKDLRIFGGLCVLFGAIFAAVAWSKHEPVFAGIAAGVATLAAVVAIWAPQLLHWIYLGAVYATFPIGFVVSHIIFATVYYVVIFPIGLLLRSFGNDPLSRSLNQTRQTYWSPRPPEKPKKSYFHQS